MSTAPVTNRLEYVDVLIVGAGISDLCETAAENGIDSKIRLHDKVRGAAWASKDGRWLVEIERIDTGEQLTMSCVAGCSVTATTKDSLRNSRALRGLRGRSCIRSTGQRIWTTTVNGWW